MVSPAAGADYRRGLGGTEHEVRSGVIFGELKWVAAEYMTNKTCSGGAIESIARVAIAHSAGVGTKRNAVRPTGHAFHRRGNRQSLGQSITQN